MAHTASISFDSSSLEALGVLLRVFEVNTTLTALG
jgi:hypothetical protein